MQEKSIDNILHIRPAQFSDLLAISKLRAESWRQTYRDIYSNEFLNHHVEKDRLDSWHSRLKFPGRNQYVTIAILDEIVVGFSCIFLDDHPVFGTLLDNLHVSKNFQNYNIGKRLMKNCMQLIVQKGSTRKMYLWVYESNTNARAFYEKLNGKKFETIKKENADRTKARSCRYIWEDVSLLI